MSTKTLVPYRAVAVSVALAFSIAAVACAGGSEDDTTPPVTTPPVVDGSSSPDASSDATIPPTDAATEASIGDATTLDATRDAPPVVDASVDAGPVAVDCVAVGTIVSWTKDRVRVDYDLSNGTASFYYDNIKHINAFYAGVQLVSYTTSKQYTTRTCVRRGDEAVVTNTGSGLPTMRQSFTLGGGNKFLAQVTVDGVNLASNWISPVVSDVQGGVDIGAATDARSLWVPFDNDAWVSYNAAPINGNGTSFEVAAFYDNATRNGLVVGSVTHDTWKTGIYWHGANGKLDAMNVFGGATDSTWSHDVIPHGKVTGNSVASPVMFVGFRADYRDLLEEYADANATYQPKLPWAGGVPFGWNSWGKIQSAISYDSAVGVSDFIKNNLQTTGFSNNNTVYINLDSYWDNLSDTQLQQFVTHVRANGQKAGIYWAPFVDWGKSATRSVEGAISTYGDIWLHNASGGPIELDGAYAIDPTHPASKARVDVFIDRFKRLGFEYVKLDFLTHGALESTRRYDSNVTTGIQAYNQGMAYILNRIAGSMFISASIAPLFPYQYAHARRVACDTYGAAVGSMSAQYELNSAAYGFWMNGRLYNYNDPDGMVFDGFNARDNMTRLLSGVISGTVFLNGDDLTKAPAQALARAYLTNDRMNAVARLGKAFRPLEGNTGPDAPDLFSMKDGTKTYLAVFNFTSNAVTKSVSLARAGVDVSSPRTVTDLWSGTSQTAQTTLSAPIDPTFGKLYVIE